MEDHHQTVMEAAQEEDHLEEGLQDEDLLEEGPHLKGDTLTWMNACSWIKNLEGKKSLSLVSHLFGPKSSSQTKSPPL